MGIRGFQLRKVAQVWGADPTPVLDLNNVIQTLIQQGGNRATLGGEPSEVVRDALNEGHLYIDQINFIVFRGWVVYVGLTGSGRAAWLQVNPHLAANFPSYGGVVPPD